VFFLVGIFEKITGLMGLAAKPRPNYLAGPAYFDYASTLATVAPALAPAGATLPMSVTRALQVPPVTRSVSLYSATIAGGVLRSSTGGSAWLQKTTGVVTPGKRLSDVFQDLFFHAEACLMVKRNEAGDIIDGLRLPRELWRVGAGGFIELLIEPAAGAEPRWTPMGDQAQFIYIPSLLPIGFLAYAEPTLSHYFDILATIQSRGANPIPLVELHVEDEWEGEPEDLEAVVDAWAAARQSRNGAVAVTPRGIKLIVHSADDVGAMLIEARNAVRLDIANYANQNASLLDGNSGTSDTYSNTLQDANEFLRLSLGLFTLPISQRLSQDDVSAPGEVITFELPGLEGFTDTKGNAVAAPAAAPVTQTGNPE
jgi:hypothetical protein